MICFDVFLCYIINFSFDTYRHLVQNHIQKVANKEILICKKEMVFCTCHSQRYGNDVLNDLRIFRKTLLRIQV